MDSRNPFTPSQILAKTGFFDCLEFLLFWMIFLTNVSKFVFWGRVKFANVLIFCSAERYFWRMFRIFCFGGLWKTRMYRILAGTDGFFDECLGRWSLRTFRGHECIEFLLDRMIFFANVSKIRGPSFQIDECSKFSATRRRF